LPDRDAGIACCRANCEWPQKIFDYAGSGMAIATLIESTVRVTIRHSDNEPMAGEAATASVSRDDAAGEERPLKPAAPGDRFMAERSSETRANHPQPPNIWLESLAILRRRAVENGGKTAGWPGTPTTPVVYARYFLACELRP
jgi:hypothetical protein